MQEEEEEEEIVDESVECEEEPIEEPAVQTEPIDPIEAEESEEDEEDDRESIRTKRLQFLSRSQSHTEASSLCRVCFNPPFHPFIHLHLIQTNTQRISLHPSIDYANLSISSVSDTAIPTWL